MAATIAVVAIFLPVVFMKGVDRPLFLQYGITVTVAVLLSLLEALTLTPMRCSRYLHVHTDAHRAWPDSSTGSSASWRSGYEDVLRVLLPHRWKTIVTTMARLRRELADRQAACRAR